VNGYDSVRNETTRIGIKEEYVRKPEFTPLVNTANKSYKLEQEREISERRFQRIERKGRFISGLKKLITTTLISSAVMGGTYLFHQHYTSPIQVAKRAEKAVIVAKERATKERRRTLDRLATFLAEEREENNLRLKRLTLPSGNEATIYLGEKKDESLDRLCINLDDDKLFVSESWEFYPENDAINLDMYEVLTEAGWTTIEREQIDKNPHLQKDYENIIEQIGEVIDFEK